MGSKSSDTDWCRTIQAIIDYIEEGSPDIEVVKSELLEAILRERKEYI